MYGLHAGHSTRYTCSRRAVQAQAWNHVAACVQVHGGSSSAGSFFAIVDKVGLAIHVNGHEAAAANVAGRWQGDCQRETDRHACIDGVTALFKNLLGSLCAKLVRR